MTCKEEDCGERIWGLIVTTYTTIVNNPDSWYLPHAHNLRKEEEKEKLLMSFFVFHNGDHKILIHQEGSPKKVAWLTRANERYDENPDVDRNKLDICYLQLVSFSREDTLREECKPVLFLFYFFIFTALHIQFCFSPPRLKKQTLSIIIKSMQGK